MLRSGGPGTLCSCVGASQAAGPKGISRLCCPSLQPRTPHTAAPRWEDPPPPGRPGLGGCSPSCWPPHLRRGSPGRRHRLCRREQGLAPCPWGRGREGSQPGESGAPSHRPPGTPQRRPRLGQGPTRVLCGLPDWGSRHAVWVVDTDYDEYALLCTSGTKGLGQDVHMASLYSRTQSPRAEVKEKFRAFAKAQGFTEDAIVFLPRNGKCIEEHE